MMWNWIFGKAKTKEEKDEDETVELVFEIEKIMKGRNMINCISSCSFVLMGLLEKQVNNIESEMDKKGGQSLVNEYLDTMKLELERRIQKSNRSEESVKI